jgi:serine/threonine-protein kinase
VAEAVAHLHALDILHRDIKPGNILIMEDGGVRLSDFGLVKNLSPSGENLRENPRTSTGAVLGTEVYMAPEQEAGQEVEKPADVYSLGVLLAELATGQRPAPKRRATQGSTVADCPALERLPRPLAQLIRRCTDVKPDQRFPNAQAAVDEFARVVAAPAG